MRKRHKAKLAAVARKGGERPGSGISIGSSNSSKRFFSFRGFKNSTTNTVASRVKALHEDISKGTSLADLIKKGFMGLDFLEAFGIFGSMDFFIRNNKKADFDFEAECNRMGIRDEELIAAGATGTSGSLDFSNFSNKKLFTENPRVRLTQYMFVCKRLNTKYKYKYNAGNPFAPLRQRTMLKLASEMSDLYKSMGDLQKDNVRKFVNFYEPKYVGLLDSGIFHTFLAIPNLILGMN